MKVNLAAQNAARNRVEDLSHLVARGVRLLILIQLERVKVKDVEPALIAIEAQLAALPDADQVPEISEPIALGPAIETDVDA